MASPSPERMWREAKYKLLSERRQAEKATARVIPGTRDPGKGATKETVKRSACDGGGGEEDGEHGGNCHQIFCPNAWDIQHQGVTGTPGDELSSVTRAPVGADCGEAVHGARARGKPVPAPQFCFDPKTSLRIKCTFKK